MSARTATSLRGLPGAGGRSVVTEKPRLAVHACAKDSSTAAAGVS